MADVSIWQSLISAVIGGGTSLATTLIQVSRKLTDLEKKATAVAEEVSQLKTQLKSDVAEVAKATSVLPQLVHTSVDALRKELEKKLDDRLDEARTTRPEIAHVEDNKRRLDDLERRVEKLRDEQSGFLRTEVFANFTEDQVRQWNELQRTLGRIEGSMRNLSPLPGSRPR